MITISLYDKAGALYQVDPHRTFVDFAENEKPDADMTSAVSCASENAIAPFIVHLAGLSARDTLDDLRGIVGKVRTSAPDREDGIKLGELLVKWADRWRGGTWELSGDKYEIEQLKARGGASGIDLSRRARAGASVTVDPSDPTLQVVGYGERMATDLEISRETGEPPKEAERDIDGARLLQRETKIMLSGSGSKGRTREPKPTSGPERAAQRRRMMQEDGLTRPTVVAGRVSEKAKDAIDNARAANGKKIGAGRMMETVGLALQSGLTYKEIESRLLGKSA